MLISAGTSNHQVDFQFERKGNFPFWTFSLFHRGAAYMKSNGHEIKTQPYDFKCIRPGTSYSTRGVPGSKHWQGDWLIGTLKTEWEELINWKEIVPGIFKINFAGTSDQEMVKNSFRDAVNYVQSSESNASLFAMHSLERVLLIASKLSEKQIGSRDERIIKAIEYISTDFSKSIDVKIIANAVGLSPSRLAHLFVEQVGESPMSYRESIRLNHAKQLLIGTNMTVQQVAGELAYDCPFHFSKRFKVRMGLSPKQFRKQIEKPGYFN